MKNILIIRSANAKVIELLINYIGLKSEETRIYMLIQKSSISFFNSKYPSINFIEKENGFFNYNKFKDNKDVKERLNEISFDETYIPSSYANFPDFQETFMIATKIKSKEKFLFNCFGEVYKLNTKFSFLVIDKYCNKIVFFIKLLTMVVKLMLQYFVQLLFMKLKLNKIKYNNIKQ